MEEATNEAGKNKRSGAKLTAKKVPIKTTKHPETRYVESSNTLVCFCFCGITCCSQKVDESGWLLVVFQDLCEPSDGNVHGGRHDHSISQSWCGQLSFFCQSGKYLFGHSFVFWTLQPVSEREVGCDIEERGYKTQKEGIEKVAWVEESCNLLVKSLFGHRSLFWLVSVINVIVAKHLKRLNILIPMLWMILHWIKLFGIFYFNNHDNHFEAS